MPEPQARVSIARTVSFGLAAGLTMLLVGVVFHVLVPVFVPAVASEYDTNPIFRPWAGPTETYMAIHPVAYGVLFSLACRVIRTGSSPNTLFRGVGGGTIFGLLIFAVGSLPVFVLHYASLDLPGRVVVCWLAQNLTQYIVAGAVLGSCFDGMVVCVSTSLKVPAETLWEKLSKKSTYLYVTCGMSSYSGSKDWPDELLQSGTSVSTKVRLFHLLPPLPHSFQVVRRDEHLHEIETDERGILVRAWHHLMKVNVVDEATSVYVDRVWIDAGILTPIVWLFAQLFYRYRQHRWRLLARELASG